jgi:hypothetical protein
MKWNAEAELKLAADGDGGGGGRERNSPASSSDLFAERWRWLSRAPDNRSAHFPPIPEDWFFTDKRFETNWCLK